MSAYQPPTKTEFRALLAKAGLTQAAAAALVDVNIRQAQRWAAGDPMPYASLAAFLVLAFKRRPGPPENWRGRVADLLPPADWQPPTGSTPPRSKSGTSNRPPP